jgi:hypothetical protein
MTPSGVCRSTTILPSTTLVLEGAPAGLNWQTILRSEDRVARQQRARCFGYVASSVDAYVWRIVGGTPNRSRALSADLVKRVYRSVGRRSRMRSCKSPVW